MTRRIVTRNLFVRIIASPITIVLLIVLVSLLSVSVYQMVKKYITVRKVALERQEELRDLQETEDRLVEDITSLQTPRGFEEEVHTRFRVAGPGESLILIVDDRDEEDVADDDRGSVRRFFHRLFQRGEQ